jgi:Zn-dependent protease with chaperone function
MSGLIAAATPWWVSLVTVLAVAIAISCSLLLVFFIAGELISRRTLKWFEELDPTETPLEEPLRRQYRFLIAGSGILYSVLLPIVVLTALVPIAFLVVAMLAVGRLPVGMLIGEVVAMGSVLSFTVMRGIRRLRQPGSSFAGEQLLPSEAPKLFTLMEQLGGAVGTDPPDRIQLFPGSVFSVYEVGTKGRSVRVLNLGLGGLIGMSKASFASIVCHELGHFRAGDTSSGHSAQQVTSNIIDLHRTLGDGIFSHLVSWMLRGIWWVHSRVTNGASRMKESIADRIAVQQFGSEAFEVGLRHVIEMEATFARTSRFAFDHAANNYKDSLLSIYDSAALSDSVKGAIQRSVEASIHTPTGTFDTHPSAADRFRQASRVDSPVAQLDGSALELFQSPISLFRRQEASWLAGSGLDISGKTPVPDEFYALLVSGLEPTR